MEAEKKLKIAEKMCKEGLEEDGASEEEIENELGVIRVQLGYCLQLQGREKEAQALYTAALKAKPDDIALVAVASNNLVCLNKDQNVFDSKKRMKSATHESLEHKLTSRQRRNIAYNQCLLAFYTDQVSFLFCTNYSNKALYSSVVLITKLTCVCYTFFRVSNVTNCAIILRKITLRMISQQTQCS